MRPKWIPLWQVSTLVFFDISVATTAALTTDYSTYPSSSGMPAHDVVTLIETSLISVIEQQAKSLKSHVSVFAAIGKFHPIWLNVTTPS
jgi:hypothetical protein